MDRRVTAALLADLDPDWQTKYATLAEAAVDLGVWDFDDTVTDHYRPIENIGAAFEHLAEMGVEIDERD